MTEQSAWDGRTYYDEPQLRPAPFNNALVGSYIFLAGLSGAAQLLATVMDYARGPGAAPTVRRGRYLAMLAPTLGTLCLILDLHTPQRFYNMLRLIKFTSPMSLGSWALVGFSVTSAATASLQFVGDQTAPLLAAWDRPAHATACRVRRWVHRHLHRAPAVRHQHAALGGGAEKPCGALRVVRRRIGGGGAAAWANGTTAGGATWTASPSRRWPWNSPPHSHPTTHNVRPVSMRRHMGRQRWAQLRRSCCC